MKKINSKKLIALMIVALLVAVGAYVYFFREKPFTNDRSYPVTQSDGINFEPPTEEEAQRADTNKNRIEEREAAIQESMQNNSGSQREVIPRFSYIGQYGAQVEIGSYVPGIFEDGGTCTAKLSKGGETITRSVQAVKNVSSVDCPLIAVSTDSFPSKGVWSVVIRYASPNATGESEIRTVEVK